jgi:formylglycine-generating enzyme required for sulfatase activity
MTETQEQGLLRRIGAVIAVPTDDFRSLVSTAGIDPALGLRFHDWSHIDFAGDDLRDMDFSGARLVACRFDGARISGARFDKAVLDRVGVACGVRTKLNEARDWREFIHDWKRPIHALSDSHLAPGMVFQDSPLAPELVAVPVGEFWMGSPDGSGGDEGDEAEPERFPDEGPRRRITMARPFAVGRFAVTFEQWEHCIRRGGTKLRPKDEGWGRGTRPVISVSWRDITEDYLPWLNDITGQTYRLLTEAEWEYCARAGSSSAFWWGNRISESNANFDTGGIRKGETRRRTVSVDQYEPNPWGLYNVHGNAFEWCHDPWRDDYNEPSPAENASPKRRAVRGGSFASATQAMRAAFRQAADIDDRSFNIGFRVARSLSP